MRSRLVNEIDEFQTMEGFLDGVTEDATGRFCEKVSTDADANPAAFPRSQLDKSRIAGRTNPFR